MSQQGYEDLDLLKNRLEELLKKYYRLRAENYEIKSKNEVLKVKLQEENDKYRELETRFERIKISGALLGGDENAGEAKEKITELVREIDRCVALLDR